MKEAADGAELDRLVRMLQLSDEFSLGMVELQEPSAYGSLMRRIRDACGGAREVIEINLEREADPEAIAPALLAARRDVEPTPVYVVSGFHAAVGALQDRPAAFRALNRQRDTLAREVHAPLLLVMRPEQLAFFREQAPDFWSVRTSVFVVGSRSGTRSSAEGRRQEAATANAPTPTRAAVGSGAVASGSGSVAAGSAAVAIGGNVSGSVIVTGSGNTVHPPRDPAEAKALREAYLHRVMAQCGSLSLAGVDRRAAGDPEAELELQAVYTALMTHATEEPDRKRETTDRPRSVSALAMLDRHPRLVLLGDPGSGKSTFVRFVAQCLAGMALGEDGCRARLTEPLPPEKPDDEPTPQPWTAGAPVPVVVVLRDFAARGVPADAPHGTAAHLWDFIADELTRAGLAKFASILHAELLDPGGMVLLDGLDEVPDADARRGRILEAVRDFADTFGASRIAVTCRTYAYQQQEWRLPGWPAAVLAPFTAGQIDRFVDRWYAYVREKKHLAAEDAAGRAVLLKHALAHSDRLRALAERPLLLTLMASLHAWRGGSLPEHREELYSEAVDLLLDWWEQQRVVRDAAGRPVVMQPSLVEWLRADLKEMRELLNRLAYEAHRDQPEMVGTADLPEDRLVTGLLALGEDRDRKPRQLVEFLSHRAGLLIPRGVGVYAFPHRTFQEYLAACWLTDEDFPDALAELARQDPLRWREVVLLAAAKAGRGSAHNVWEVADALCPGEVRGETGSRVGGDAGMGVADLWGALLAGQVLAESADSRNVRERYRLRLDRVRQWLVRVMRSQAPVQLPAIERAAAGRALAKLGDPRPEVMHAERIAWCEVPKGKFWMGSDATEGYDDERPRHEVDIPYEFRISRYPVTQAQFAEFVAAGGYGEARYWEEAEAAGRWREGFVGEGGERRTGPRSFGEPYDLSNHPVVGVTWYEALAFTRWLTERMHTVGALTPTWEVRVPSEAEWEKAARGTDGRHFPWGDEPDPQKANYDDTQIEATSAVGCFPSGASPCAVEEMAGNVVEWTRSLWGAYWREPVFRYPYQPSDGREKLSADVDVLRVLRGGSFNCLRGFARCASRYHDLPDLHDSCVGFRVVSSPSTTPS